MNEDCILIDVIQNKIVHFGKQCFKLWSIVKAYLRQTFEVWPKPVRVRIASTARSQAQIRGETLNYRSRAVAKGLLKAVFCGKRFWRVF